MSKAVLICGDRYWKDEKTIEDFIRTLPSDARVITGGAKGADTIAENLRKKRGLDGKVYKAEWNILGNAAGPIRNRRMIMEERPYLVVAFHNKIFRSKGTIDTLRRARQRGIPSQLRKSDGSIKHDPKV